MMAILNRNQELPRDRADLYAQASRVLLHQWDTERALEDFPGTNAEIGPREKTDILRRVAAHMQADPASLKGNLIDGSSLTSVIEKYLRDELHFTQARAVARAVVEQLRQRNFILCFVGADSYAFVHRTFLEYFCAVDVVHRFNVAKTLDDSGLLDLFDVHCGDDEWHEVLRLICGQIDESFVAAIIAKLLRHDNLDSWNGNVYLAGLGLALAIMTDMRNPSLLGTMSTDLLDSLLTAIARTAQHPTATLIRQLDEIASAVEAIGPRWPRAKEILPLATPIFQWGGKGMRIWPRVAVALQDSDQRAGLAAFALSGVTPEVRAGALEALAEKWPDDTTRALLTQRAVQDDSESPRSAALHALAEIWPDDTTRALLIQRAARDVSASARSTAIYALMARWLDDTTRDLLAERAVRDDDGFIRYTSLRTLAAEWPDEASRTLLAERAVKDNDAVVRFTALEALAEKWPDKPTRALLAARAVEDSNSYVRGSAFSVLGIKHSAFAATLLAESLGELGIRCDPHEPVPRKVIEEAAAKAGIDPDNIDAQIKSISEYVGWDITVGAKKMVKKAGRSKHRRKPRES